MKRRFASPFLTSHDPLVSHADFSKLSKADRCLTQPDLRNFSSPVVVKRARESSVGNSSKSKQIFSSNQPDDQSTEVPKTPNSYPKAESATRTSNRRLFHVPDKCSQLSTLLSSPPLRRISSQYYSTTKPSILEQANKRECREGSKSRSDTLKMQVGRNSSKAINLQFEMVDNQALSSTPTPFQLSNDIDSSSTKPSTRSDVEFLQPGNIPIESELVPSPRKWDSQDCIKKAGNLSNVLQASEFVQMTRRCAPGGSPNISMPSLTSLKRSTKLTTGTISSLEVFAHPPALQHICALYYKGEPVLDDIRGMAENPNTANSPARSAKESELMNDCIKKLKSLLVPPSIPLANLLLRKKSPHNLMPIALALNTIQPLSHSTRESIEENARSRKAAQPEILVNEEEVNACLNTFLVKTTRLRQEVSGETNSHLRLPPQQQDRNLNRLHVVCDGISYNANHLASTSPYQRTTADVTTAHALSRKERLAPNSLYIAQSLEFRSIWSSKRLKMAEIVVSCLTQNEFLFSTLI